MNPHISVIIPACELNNHVFPAIDSILSQSFQDIEVILCLNGPEATLIEAEVLERYGSYIRIVKTPIHQLAHALNIGISVARASLIARMDSDDIAHKERLERQVEFLQHYNLDMVGCDVDLIDENGQCIGKRIFPKGKNIDHCLPFKNVFCHSSVLYKKDKILESRAYNAGYNSEDYDLWLRLKNLGIQWDNMPERLLKYRIHNSTAQRSKLGYAEVVGYSAREFVMNKSFTNFMALNYNFIKSLFRAK